jgi:hypothetical protein
LNNRQSNYIKLKFDNNNSTATTTTLENPIKKSNKEKSIIQNFKIEIFLYRLIQIFFCQTKKGYINERRTHFISNNNNTNRMIKPSTIGRYHQYSGVNNQIQKRYSLDKETDILETLLSPNTIRLNLTVDQQQLERRKKSSDSTFSNNSSDLSQFSLSSINANFDSSPSSSYCPTKPQLQLSSKSLLSNQTYKATSINNNNNNNNSNNDKMDQNDQKGSNCALSLPNKDQMPSSISSASLNVSNRNHNLLYQSEDSFKNSTYSLHVGTLDDYSTNKQQQQQQQQQQQHHHHQCNNNHLVHDKNCLLHPNNINQHHSSHHQHQHYCHHSKMCNSSTTNNQNLICINEPSLNSIQTCHKRSISNTESLGGDHNDKVYHSNLEKCNSNDEDKTKGSIGNFLKPPGLAINNISSSSDTYLSSSLSMIPLNNQQQQQQDNNNNDIKNENNENLVKTTSTSKLNSLLKKTISSSSFQSIIINNESPPLNKHHFNQEDVNLISKTTLTTKLPATRRLSINPSEKIKIINENEVDNSFFSNKNEEIEIKNDNNRKMRSTILSQSSVDLYKPSQSPSQLTSAEMTCCCYNCCPCLDCAEPNFEQNNNKCNLSSLILISIKIKINTLIKYYS